LTLLAKGGVAGGFDEQDAAFAGVVEDELPSG
jgi:hypothetical protein